MSFFLVTFRIEGLLDQDSALLQLVSRAALRGIQPQAPFQLAANR